MALTTTSSAAVAVSCAASHCWLLLGTLLCRKATFRNYSSKCNGFRALGRHPSRCPKEWRPQLKRDAPWQPLRDKPPLCRPPRLCRHRFCWVRLDDGQTGRPEIIRSDLTARVPSTNAGGGELWPGVAWGERPLNMDITEVATVGRPSTSVPTCPSTSVLAPVRPAPAKNVSGPGRSVQRGELGLPKVRHILLT